MTKDRYRPKWTEREDQEAEDEPEEEKPKAKAPPVINLRSLWHTRLVIDGSRTLTGKRYVFDPGEVKSLPAVDAERLLVMEKQQPKGCCGGDPNPPALKYFQVV